MTNIPEWLPKRDQDRSQKARGSEELEYLGSVMSSEGSKLEILCRIAQTIAAFSKQKPIWRDKNISLFSKAKLIYVLRAIC